MRSRLGDWSRLVSFLIVNLGTRQCWGPHVDSAYDMVERILVKEGLQSGLKVSVHLLPCSVRCKEEAEIDKGEAAARVEEYLVPTIREDEANGDSMKSEGYSASFRGRPLVGIKVQVPDGFSG